MAETKTVDELSPVEMRDPALRTDPAKEAARLRSGATSRATKSCRRVSRHSS